MLKPTKSTHRKALSRAILPALAVTALFTSTQLASAATDPEIGEARTAFSTADIEAVSGIASSYAERMRDESAGGTIKLTGKHVKTLTKDATEAILAKVARATTTPTDTGRLSFDNAADEIVESAAFILDGIATNAKLAKLGTQKALVLTIFKAVVTAVKRDAPILTPQISLFRDLAGSIALTLRNEAQFGSVSNPTQFAKLVKFLDKKSKSLAGKTNDAQIQQGLDEGFSGSADAVAKYEDGNVDANLVPDETDIHNA
jgi:hypothetical protein